MTRWLATLRSAAVLVLLWLYMLAAGAIAVPWTLLSGRLSVLYRVGRFGIRALTRLAAVRTTLVAAATIPAGPVLYMANHQSNLDPPLLIAHLPGEIVFLPKRELFHAPILGGLLRLARFVPIDRGDRAAAQASLDRAAEVLRAGRPMVVFPEGTRGPEGGLLPFKKGPFFLAEQAGVPVVPVRIDGAGHCLPRGDWRIFPGRVRLTVMPAILPAEWQSAPDPREHLSALVRSRLSAATAAVLCQ